jgi:hypothetical protein
VVLGLSQTVVALLDLRYERSESEQRLYYAPGLQANGAGQYLVHLWRLCRSKRLVTTRQDGVSCTSAHMQDSGLHGPPKLLADNAQQHSGAADDNPAERSRVDPARVGRTHRIDPPARGHQHHVRELAVKGPCPKRGQVVSRCALFGTLP